MRSFYLATLLLLVSNFGQAQQNTSAGNETLHADGVEPMRFVAVHGRRSVIMGYPATGLEVWGYPFQILSHYQIGFRQHGSTTEIEGQTLLRRVDYQRESITRIYIGPDYLVRERLFVPLDKAAVVITYEVQGRRPVDINIHFQPVLNLMWPGAVGGQYTRWLDEAPGYSITEPGDGVSALVASPEAIAHDDTLNSTVQPETNKPFTIRPRSTSPGIAKAAVYVLLNGANEKEPFAILRDLSDHVHEQELQAEAHYATLDSNSLRLHTPDADVNTAFAWAENALDQAWVCNPKVGCGIVAGYGPSRDARRPQYDWYFAGDGLIATNALVSAGEYLRAREELEFITKYQEPTTGMIWHELSQSSGYIDWSKYPYMYVHVDISFDYLSTIARYVATSGNRSFAVEHWESIAKAYRYCRSLIRDADHLPHIPADKEGGDEQARPGDDLSLSAGWLAASKGFEEVARLTGHVQQADEAHRESQLVQEAIPSHYWDVSTNFWIDGHTQAGTPIRGRRRGPSSLIEEHVFSPQQNEHLLNQLASSDFQTDWGLREVAASSEDYDPYSYGRGSVTAPGTTQTAITFWKDHRPATGNTIWNEILPWNTLDAPGHIHEVLAGNFYHEQAESVPEQTWSSAGLVDAAVRGMLGLEVHGLTNSIDFVPHLPPQWDSITIDNVRLPNSRIKFILSQGMNGLDLRISNQGVPTRLQFRPQIPAGARLLKVTFQDRDIPTKTELFSQDEHASVSLAVPVGESHVHLHFEGGVSMVLHKRTLYVGDASKGIKLGAFQLRGQTLAIEADVHPQGEKSFTLRTGWKVLGHQGASVVPLSKIDYEVTFTDPTLLTGGDVYKHTHATLTFTPK